MSALITDSLSSMLRQWLRRIIPHPTHLREHRHLRWAGPWLAHHNLWHINRYSVAGGVAAGMIGGLIPLPLQMVVAAILALIFRVNLPVAVATTLLSNPLTWPFIFVIAIAIGELFTGRGKIDQVTEFQFDWGQQPLSALVPAIWDWLLGLGWAFVIGDLILAAMLAVLGYFAVHLFWRLHLLAYLRRRAKRLRRQDQ
jgi:uncharacterized protein (DUF2062 family)